MAIQIVMDHTGDTRHHFNPDDAQALAKAEERFKNSRGLASLRLSGPLRGGSPRFNHSIRTQKKPCSFRGWSAASQIGGSCSCFNDLCPRFARVSMPCVSFTGKCWVRSRRMLEASS